MRAALYVWKDDKWVSLDGNEQGQCDLVLIKGHKVLIQDITLRKSLLDQFGDSEKVFISTSGEFGNMHISDHGAIATALYFDQTSLQIEMDNIRSYRDSEEFGAALGSKLLIRDDLHYVMLLSDGAEVNGTALLNGLSGVLPEHILITGGMAGDMYEFNSTVIGHNEVIGPGNCVLIGFYNQSLQVSHGSFGGWQNFGPLKRVTRSIDNILFEIDGKNALELYKKYLGPYANELPGSALLFPLSVELEDGEQVVRTILSINEEEGSMTFAGDIPQGAKVRFMRANIDKLVDASTKAAVQAIDDSSFHPQWAFGVSCVGRKLVLKHRVDEEIEALKQVFPEDCPLSGFYSYGELSPVEHRQHCVLQNQTMTVTLFAE